MEIDKLSTAMGTNDSQPRPYRFGYGVLAANLNGLKDSGEQKVYFEFSEYSSPSSSTKILYKPSLLFRLILL